MNPATTEFLRQRFTEYYKKTVLVSPSSLEQREWGFVLFNPGSAEMRMRTAYRFLRPGRTRRLYPEPRPPARLLLDRVLREA